MASQSGKRDLDFKLDMEGFKSVAVFVAKYAADPVEGRGPMVPFAYFFDRADAEVAVKGKGVCGADGEVGEIAVYGNIQDWLAESSRGITVH